MGQRKTAVFIGNSIFGDDAIGLVVGEALRPKLEGDGFDVQVLERTGFALLDCLEGYDSAFVVDSFCNRTMSIGSVAPFSVEDFGAVKPVAPHYSGVPEAVRLMKELGMKVPDLSIIGINVGNPYALSSAIDRRLDALKGAISAKVYERIADHGGGE